MTGWPAGLRLVAFLVLAVGEGSVLATGEGPSARAGGDVGVVKQQRRQRSAVQWRIGRISRSTVFRRRKARSTCAQNGRQI